MSESSDFTQLLSTFVSDAKGAQGSFGIFDMIVRINSKTDHFKESLAPAFHHEWTHYAQIAATPAGFLWSNANAYIQHLVQQLIVADKSLLRKPLAALKAEDGSTESERDLISNLREALVAAERFWGSVEEASSLNDLVDDDQIVRIDRTAKVIRVGDDAAVPITPRSVMEFLARCVEYGSRSVTLGIEPHGLTHRMISKIMPIPDRSIIPSKNVSTLSGKRTALYDWASLYGEQNGIFPVNAYTMHITIASWVYLFAADTGENLEKAADIFLDIATEPLDEIAERYRVFRFNLDDPDSIDRYLNPIEIADASCKRLGIKPFSHLIQEHLARLKDFLDWIVPQLPAGNLTVEMHLAKFGIAFLEGALAYPLRLYMPFVGNPGDDVERFGPIIRTDGADTFNGDPSIVPLFIKYALQREALFCDDHSAYFRDGQWRAAQCPFGPDCTSTGHIPDEYLTQVWHAYWKADD